MNDKIIDIFKWGAPAAFLAAAIAIWVQAGFSFAAVSAVMIAAALFFTLQHMSKMND